MTSHSCVQQNHRIVCSCLLVGPKPGDNARFTAKEGVRRQYPVSLVSRCFDHRKRSWCDGFLLVFFLCGSNPVDAPQRRGAGQGPNAGKQPWRCLVLKGQEDGEAALSSERLPCRDSDSGIEVSCGGSRGVGFPSQLRSTRPRVVFASLRLVGGFPCTTHTGGRSGASSKGAIGGVT